MAGSGTLLKPINIQIKRYEEIQMNIKFLLTGVFLFLVMTAYGCNTAAPYRVASIENDRGRAYETARFNQIMNTHAGARTEPVEGFDGSAAAYTLDKYRKGFMKEEKTTNVFTIHTQAK